MSVSKVAEDGAPRSGGKLIFQNVYFMPSALMKRELRFRELSIIRIVANLVEFAAKVGFAAAGFGIWCFVFGPLGRVLVTGIGAQICHPWRPKAVLKLRETYRHLSNAADRGDDAANVLSDIVVKMG